MASLKTSRVTLAIASVCFSFLLTVARANEVTESTTEDSAVTLNDDKDDLRMIIQAVETLAGEISANVSGVQTEYLQRFHEVERRLAMVELQVRQLEEAFNNSSRNSEVEHLLAFPGELHEPLRRLHQKHEEQVSRVQLQHEELNHTIATLHRQVVHITDLHDMPRRLRKIADLIVANRWHEVMLNWAFVENNLLHEENMHAYQLLAEHLRTVIYNVGAGTGSDSERLQRLLSLFKFVHRLHSNAYKSYAYPTLVDELLTDSDLFKGHEIFILAQFVRQQLMWSNQARAALPRLPNLVALKPNVKLALVSQSKGAITATDPRLPAPLRNDSRLSFPEIHIKGEVIKKKKDKKLSFKFPVTASPFNSYSPESSGSWNVVYNESGHFMIKNVENEAFLNVPSESEYLNTRVSDDGHMRFNLYLLDDFTIGIESADYKKPLIAVECEDGSTCFIVRGGQGHSRHHWTGSKFALFPLSEPFDPSGNFFV